MLPHKTARGARALARLKIFEGVPPPFDRKKRMVVPEALRVLRLAPRRRFTVIGELSKGFGWKHSEAIEKLEAKRKIRSAAWYSRKKAILTLRRQAEKNIAPSINKKRKIIKNTLGNAGYLAFRE